MAKQKTVHTLQSIEAMTTEEGECRLWNGYTGNGVPMVFHAGKLIQVRKLVLMLNGQEVTTLYTSAKCNNPLCVEHAHIVQRSPKQHHVHMGKRVATAPSNAARIAKITKTRRDRGFGKLDQEKAAQIRLSDESGPVLAERFGVTRAMVNRIKSGHSWAHEFGNPFAGLGARA